VVTPLGELNYGMRTPGLVEDDSRRFESMIDFVRSHDTAGAFEAILPSGIPIDVMQSLAKHCRFLHGALLVFPDDLDAAVSGLASFGVEPAAIAPSVVVRNRVAARLDVPARSLEVSIVHCAVPGPGEPRHVEVFLLPPCDVAGIRELAEDERVYNWEAYFAFGVPDAEEVVLGGVHRLLTGQGGMVCDGGGYNAHLDVTMLYFQSATPLRHEGMPWPPRIALMIEGHHPGLLRTHVSRKAASGEAHPGPDGPARDMLDLLTGAWITQAVSVAARLGLADLINQGVATVAELAEATQADDDRLGRLIRLLAAHGVLHVDDLGLIKLTERGDLLRTDVVGSMNALADLYGGLFFQSFLGLEHAVRTGESAFTHVFGQEPFDYFADHAAAARLFEGAMAFGRVVFDRLPDAVDLSAMKVVVDLGGGDGHLMARLLRSAPHLRGVVFDRPHVINATSRTLAAFGCTSRCEILGGDFFADPLPTGGDLYVLSRILHGWDDSRCLTLLTALRAAIPDTALLAVVERPVIDASVPSLPLRYDIQMMTNADGRERTIDEYRALLARAGFELYSQRDLALDMAVMLARPRSARER